MGQGKIGGEATVKTSVQLWINGQPYTVTKDIPPETSLNVFIRDHVKLKGTKAMCLEGGCGVCIVSAEIHDKTLAVNSCLVPILICDGWKIKTIEGIGSKKKGYHKIQATLAHMNGSQCGYCSPGMVMNMYSLIQDKTMTMKEIENSFGGNICRCTGYRPILDAFKSFASDADPALAKNIQDIEELYKLKACPKSGKPCIGDCWEDEVVIKPDMVFMDMEDSEFYKLLSLEALFAVFANNPNATYILNGGNTAQGVYRSEKPEIYVDVNDIPDLHRVEKDCDTLTLGGNVSLNETMNTFEKFSEEPGFGYLRHMANHIDLIATVPIRNIGTLAGNLMLKHQHREFPSDLFLILETAGAEMHILEDPATKKVISFLEFLDTDMKHKIIYSIVLKALDNEYDYRSYKIMPRAQNSHAHVNAGFLFKLDGAGKVLEKPNIIIGGINDHFLHATATESFLEGKVVLDKNVLCEALKVLDSELKPDHKLPDYSPEFRKTLAISLFYKYVLSIKPDSVNKRLRSGGTILERGLSSGRHEYDTDKYLWPVTKPMPKIEAIYQTSGEAQYVNDIPTNGCEVYCAFVLTEFPNGKVVDVDTKDALAMKGVIAFFSAKDVPGKNLSIDSTKKEKFLDRDETLFVDNDIEYTGQPIGVIVAETNALANEAARKVKVTYSDVLKEKAIVTIDDVIASGDKTRLFKSGTKSAKHKGNDVTHVIKGEFNTGSQYHFTMETQSCVCIPTEDGMDVYPASQWMDLTQVSIATCLGVPINSIVVNVRRLGGGYGAKFSRSTAISCTCALVCHLLNRPTRFVMTIEGNMSSIGKRYSMRQVYEVGFNDEGLIQYLNSDSWGNAGASFNEPLSQILIEGIQTCYDSKTWSCVGFEAKTETPSNTFCRAPATTEAICMTENIMDRIARTLAKDPVEVRLLNMDSTYKEALLPMIEAIKKSSDYEIRKRAVKVFNSENRWKKKGISLVPMRYNLEYFGQYQSMVSIFARDGTVSVVHGGIECGQGINTKVAQVAAHTLGIDLCLVSVKPTNTIIAPNNSVSGASHTSESCSYATMMVCKELIKRLEPIKAKLDNPTWQELIMAAYMEDVDLCARYMLGNNIDPASYPIYGVAVSEVEIDILTGQHIIQRVDIIEDAGISSNPEIDLGQVEGAFIMGVGLWTSEDLIYDPKTGVLTNNRTWNYKPPGAKDIPVDFRVTFRRNSPNPLGLLRSKATGEPPMCLSCSIPLAIRHALNSARADAGNTDVWYPLDGPVTTEKILLTSLTNKDVMVL